MNTNEPRPAGAFIKQEGTWRELPCECPRCKRTCLAIIESFEEGESEVPHFCEHCDKSFNVEIGG